MKRLLFAAALLSSPSYAFICELGPCTEQCTSPDSVIGEQPLPSSPDIGNGNYVDCVYACIDLKKKLQCDDGTALPRIEGKGNNLENGHLATVPIFEAKSFRAYVEPDFTPLDRTLLKEAFELAYEQLGVMFLSDPMNSEFGKCTKPSTYDSFAMADFWGLNFLNENNYGRASIWREAREPFIHLIPGFPGIKYDVRVVKTWDDDALGEARIGSHTVTRPVIALNWNYMKGYRKNADGTFSADSSYGHPAFWASTIVHEIMHTAGYDHPTFVKGDTASYNNYLNTFMVHFSDCIERVGMPETFDPNSSLFLRE